METALISALAALAGSAIGSLAPVLSNVILQRSATQREFLVKSVMTREALYADFIDQEVATVSREAVRVYALIGRMKLVSSTDVVTEAETLVRGITANFAQKNLSLMELRRHALTDGVSPMAAFSAACRVELSNIVRTMHLPRETIRGASR